MINPLIKGHGDMKIEIVRCDLCKVEYKMGVGKNFQEVGNIRLDFKGCYHIQMAYEKEVCSKCAYKVNHAVCEIIKSLTKEESLL